MTHPVGVRVAPPDIHTALDARRQRCAFHDRVCPSVAVIVAHGLRRRILEWREMDIVSVTRIQNCRQVDHSNIDTNVHVRISDVPRIGGGVVLPVGRIGRDERSSQQPSCQIAAARHGNTVDQAVTM